MRKRKTDRQLKEEFWMPHFDILNPRERKAYEQLVSTEAPACASEAVFILHERMLDLASALPIIGKFIR